MTIIKKRMRHEGAVTMKKSTLSMISILIALFGIICAVQDASAVDPPHNGKNSLNLTMTCTTCHFDTAGPTPSWATQPTTTDETYYNNLCTSCHIPSTGMESRYVVKTHSSSNTSGKYGAWTVECRRCHNPHLQDQVSSYPTDTTANLLFGTITAYTQPTPVTLPSSTIFVSTSMTPGQWTDHILIPNVAYPTKMYHIRTNTNNAIIVSGVIDGRYAKATNTFVIRTGTMVLGQIQTPSGTLATVKFFTNDPSKPNSYGSSTDPFNVTGICQVCHSSTTSFNSAGTGSLQAGPTHPVVGTQVCTDCHIHTQGFQGGCNACHGYPPDSPSTLVFKNKLGGDVVSDSGTGPGAHRKHVDSVKLVCANCHANGMLSGQGAGDDKINIGFSWNGDTNGSYDGKSGRLVYPLTGTNVTLGNTNACSNIYCHSSGQGATANNPTPVYASPQWNVPSSGACGTCHQTKAGSALGAISSGSHTVHIAAAGVNGCGDCHAGAANDASSYDSTNHVNRSIDVANGYNAGGPAGNGYGTCNAASCHVSAYGVTSIVTPTWGNTAGCGACHPIAADGAPATGSHAKHIDTVLAVCGDCHTGAVKDSNPGTAHLDGNIDVTNGYPANVAKHAAGSGYSTCSTASCHVSAYGVTSIETPTWGTTAGCGSCHPIAADGAPATGSHAKHMALPTNPDCSVCHTGASKNLTGGGASHANGTVEVTAGYSASPVAKHAPGGYTGTCNNASCHVSAYGPTLVTTPVWSTAAGCGACHPIAADGAPATGSHALHIDTVGTLCGVCHTGAVKDVNAGSAHLNTKIDVTQGYLTSPVTKHTAGSGYSSCSAAVCHGASSPTWGNNTANAQCVKCHGVAGSTVASYLSDPNRAAPGYYAASAPTGTGVDTAGQTGTVTSNVSNDAQVGAHNAHLKGLGGYGRVVVCADCHAVSAIGDPGHMDGTTTFTWSNLAKNIGTTPYNTDKGPIVPTYAAGTCSTNYCHGGGFAAAVVGTNPTPTWTNTTYLANSASAMNSADCNMCHLSPPTGSAKYNHNGVTLGVGNCQACHNHDGYGDSRHIDGILQAQGGACDSCHDYDTTAIGTSWGKNSKAIEGWGAHALHIEHLKTLSGKTLSAATDTFGNTNFNAVCGVCHTQNPGNHAMSGGPRWVNFGDGSNVNRFSTSATITYNGIAGVSSAVTPKTCSNVNCHFQPTPVWQGF